MARRNKLQGKEPKSICLSRRQWLEVGGLTALGLSAERLRLLRKASARTSTLRPAQACVFIFLFGGPSHLDLWDLKPEAPEEIRGTFRPIDTRAPGLTLCEHLPRLAGQADKLCLLRSMTHQDRVHGTACSEVFTGRPHKRPGSTDQASPDDFPSLSSLTMRFGASKSGLPSSVVLPWYLQFAGQGERIAGQTGALMGERYNAFLVRGDPTRGDFRVPALQLPSDMSAERIRARQRLLSSVEERLQDVVSGETGRVFSTNHQTAFSMLAGPKTASAFELSREPSQLRDLYGSTIFGQSLLLARRLVETGVSLVTVNWDDESRDEKVSPFWDTHDHNFEKLQGRLLPVFDRALAAFLEDLSERGLLDSTLVVAVGEFGRSPFIGKISQNDMTEKTGRDHWPHAFTALLAGGGCRGGSVFGASDGIGAYVRDDPVTPADLAATVLTQLGVDPSLRYRDSLGVEHDVCIGKRVESLF